MRPGNIFKLFFFAFHRIIWLPLCICKNWSATALAQHCKLWRKQNVYVLETLKLTQCRLANTPLDVFRHNSERGTPRLCQPLTVVTSVAKKTTLTRTQCAGWTVERNYREKLQRNSIILVCRRLFWHVRGASVLISNLFIKQILICSVDQRVSSESWGVTDVWKRKIKRIKSMKRLNKDLGRLDDTCVASETLN